MLHALARRLATLIWIAAFGLGQAVIAPFGVTCVDASGQGRLEFACFKSLDGSCLTECDARETVVHPACDSPQEPADPGHHTPHPCEDTPVGDTAGASRLVSRADPLDACAPPAIAVLPQPDAPAPSAAPLARRARPDPRPPDGAARLRSVILIV